MICSLFFSPVKCIKNTPAYFAERLHKAMQVNSIILMTLFLSFCSLIATAVLAFEPAHWSRFSYAGKWMVEVVSRWSPTLRSFNREPEPRTTPWSASWCPALRSTCWTSGRPTCTPMENRCTQPSQWVLPTPLLFLRLAVFICLS